jgi:hypothetical protein
MNGIEAHPLCWPTGWPRRNRTTRSRFNATFAVARDCLFNEIRLMNGSSPILSTNVELRRDGLPYATRREPEDSAVAVYFTYKKKQLVFASDRWDKVQDNIQAIRKTIEALRGIERWGASDMMERAFTGFVALPDHSNRTWWQVLGVTEDAHPREVRTAYKRKCVEVHPDKPNGNKEMFQDVQNAYNQYQQQ